MAPAPLPSKPPPDALRTGNLPSPKLSKVVVVPRALLDEPAALLRLCQRKLNVKGPHWQLQGLTRADEQRVELVRRRP